MRSAIRDPTTRGNEADVILACGCGQKLNVAGAPPGRVGKCPRCGSMFRVPGGPPSPESSPPPEPASKAAREPVGTGAGVGTFHRRAARDKPDARATGGWHDGLVPIPPAPERSVLGSLDYPLRNASGLGILAMIPPLLWFGSFSVLAVVRASTTGSALTLAGLLLLLPQLAVLAAAVGHVLLFLGDVVVTSCLGDAALPRQASWDPGEIARGWARWAWALVAGGGVGGIPALAYWVRCGDLDWFDRVVLVELLLPGVAYAQLVLVLALIHDTPRVAANPALVARALVAGGWAYVVPCLVTGGCLLAAWVLLDRCLALGHALAQAVAFWAWWVVLLYLAMVALRTLGLFCYRRKVVRVSPGRLR